MRLTSTEFSILEQYYLNEIEENKTRLVRVMCNRDITYDDDLIFEQKNRINKKIALIENRMEELKGSVIEL
mgnify:CR=1 FL=1